MLPRSRLQNGQKRKHWPICLRNSYAICIHDRATKPEVIIKNHLSKGFKVAIVKKKKVKFLLWKP